ncbi:MAG: trehalose-phosphatase [Spirochaetes bacterium]|nr:trehalose-phosphatase [Spirochaetota bacterium]
MAEYFFSSSIADKVINSLRMKPRILAFDFDGTLAPIADSPAEAAMPGELRRLLENLSLDNNTVIAIVSGRRLSELEQMIRIPSIIYFGNHGMTSSVEGFGAGREQLRKWSDESSMIHEKILCLESKYKGCIIENKGPVISVHYRKVDADKVKELGSLVKEIAGEHDVDLKNGKMVIELKPRTNFTKGTALSEIALKRFAGWSKDDPFLFAGDDNTDEDGFRAMKDFGERSFGFKIGDGETSADFRLLDGEILNLIKLII